MRTGSPPALRFFMFDQYINLLGDTFPVLSLREVPPHGISPEGIGSRIVLTPSLVADIRSDTVGLPCEASSLISALCAAAFLILRRGLPLDPVSVETDDGIFEIFHTDACLFEIKFKISKQIFTKREVECLGCVSTLYESRSFRIIRVADLSFVTEEALCALSLSHGAPMPVLPFSAMDGEVFIGSAVLPSPPAVFVAAVVACLSFECGRESRVRIGGYDVTCRRTHDGVVMRLAVTAAENPLDTKPSL